MIDVSRLLTRADTAREAGKTAEALQAYAQAHAADPGRVYPLYWLATLEQEAGHLEAARDYCRNALRLDPDQIGLLLRYADIAAASFDDATALEYYQRVARFDPDIPGLDAHLADCYCRLGRIRDGVAAFDRAIARAPDEVALQDNRLFVLNYSGLLTPEQLFAEHREWGARHEATLRPKWRPFDNVRDSARRLAIGYVSSDLRDHAVASFIEPLLRAHDAERFDVHCFDTSNYAQDAVTFRLRQVVPEWHRVGHLDDDALSADIRQKGIDILIDLAGHTSGNRLLTFARRPAPVQATWLGYLNTTGLTAVDYRISDSHLDPPGLTEELHTERLMRLATHACFAPWPDSPAISPSPVNGRERLTYGSVNQWPKVADPVKDVWAQILLQAPEARLLIVARGTQHNTVRARVIDDFARRGVRPEQVTVHAFLPSREFLQLLGQVDVALDPFPYGGGTTTMHCLWMGVPVVTLRGRTAMARNSVGILDAVGLADLGAATMEEYRDTALALGRDHARLAMLRSVLRIRMTASRLMDADAFARDFERALVAMWEGYCGHGTGA